MKKEEILKYIQFELQKRMEPEGQTVMISKVIKTNDIELDALTFSDGKTEVSPTIYLNDYYAEVNRGRSLLEIVDEIYDIFKNRTRKLSFDVNNFEVYEKMKDGIAFRLVNTAMNEKLLRDVPHRDFLDLSIIYYCVIPGEEPVGSATALIHNSHLKIWKVTEDELYRQAVRNTQQLFPCVIRSMDDIIRELLEDGFRRTVSAQRIKEEPDYCRKAAQEEFDHLSGGRIDDLKMYVMSNQSRLQGASCILYQDALLEFSTNIQKDLYILPSSIHEVILVPVLSRMKESELSAMVREVNRDAVNPEEVLSDHVYFYSRESNQIFIA